MVVGSSAYWCDMFMHITTLVNNGEFKRGIHPAILSRFRKYLEEHGWGPTPMLVYLLKSDLLSIWKFARSFIILKYQKELLFISIIGNFNWNSKMYPKLVTNKRELKFLVSDLRWSDALIGAPQIRPLAWILTYLDGSQPKTHSSPC